MESRQKPVLIACSARRGNGSGVPRRRGPRGGGGGGARYVHERNDMEDMPDSLAFAWKLPPAIVNIPKPEPPPDCLPLPVYTAGIVSGHGRHASASSIATMTCSARLLEIYSPAMHSSHHNVTARSAGRSVNLSARPVMVMAFQPTWQRS